MARYVYDEGAIDRFYEKYGPLGFHDGSLETLHGLVRDSMRPVRDDPDTARYLAATDFPMGRPNAENSALLRGDGPGGARALHKAQGVCAAACREAFTRFSDYAAAFGPPDRAKLTHEQTADLKYALWAYEFCTVGGPDPCLWEHGVRTRMDRLCGPDGGNLATGMAEQCRWSGTRRGGLDMKAAEIEANGPGPDEPEY